MYYGSTERAGVGSVEGMSAGRRKAGFSLLEVVVALGVLAISMTGIVGLLLVSHQHNTSTNETTIAAKACEEMMETLRTMTYAQVKAQNGVTFVATGLHPTQPLGTVAVTDVSPPGDPDTIVEVRVSITTVDGQVTRKPVNVQLVSWRTSK